MRSAAVRIKNNLRFLVALALLAAAATVAGACSGNSNTKGLDLVGAKVAAFAATDQYLRDHPERAGSVADELTRAEALLAAGTGTFNGLEAVLFARVDDPRRQFYFGVVFDLIAPQISDREALIKPGSSADLLIRSALSGARQALAIPPKAK